MARDRYAIPNPLCQHVPTVRVSSHEDLAAALKEGGEIASTVCCDREACQDDARKWLYANTRDPSCHIIPLKRRQRP